MVASKNREGEPSIEIKSLDSNQNIWEEINTILKKEMQK
jgi:hypothetical protein